ncbi:MAG TPA: hypothetical protein VJU34_13570, partial [Phenylobacterium sp.]|nr:hypothetical protein [Phenylobacterium sp.]
AAVVTGARYAARLGPPAGPAEAFWRALFRRTYAAEFRVESTDRADTVIASAHDRYVEILPMAWREGRVAFTEAAGTLRPRKRGLPSWTWPNLAGKPLNLARILKAAFTFDGAARYAAYKVERHTGIEIAVTPFRERHPFLAAPGAWIELRRRQRALARASSPNGK